MFNSTPSLPNGSGGLLILIGFVAAMVWIVWLDRRRSQFNGASEVSGAEQAVLGQEARAFYTDPLVHLCNPATPSEFDTHLLSLFESIETNRDDIDAKLESVRLCLKGANLIVRTKDRYKLDRVFSGMGAYLLRSHPGESRMGRQQLAANWRMVGRLANSELGWSRVPESWIRPLDSAPDKRGDYVSRGPSRGIVVLPAFVQLLLGALIFSVIGAMIAYAVRSEAALEGVPLWLVVGIGIFVAFWISYGLGWIRPYSRTGSPPQRRP